MPLPYSLFVRHELYEVIRGMRPAWRIAVIRFLESLASDPFQTGDYAENDPSDRTLHVKVVGPWAIVFWSDHPVCEVKVVQILPSDR
jgi:hypothetical protein